MSISRFQQLEQIIHADFNNTYIYLNKNFEFIDQISRNFADYLGHGHYKLSYVDSEGNITNLQNSVVVDNECFFNFGLLLHTDLYFNINNSGASFFEKNLPPLSGVILFISVKQQDNLFIVKIPSVAEDKIIAKEILIIPNSDDSWMELLESCFQAIKKTFEGGLQRRISKLKVQTDNVSERVMGFRV